MDARSLLLSDDEVGGIVFEHKGVQLEVRPPTMKQQSDFARLSKDKKTGEMDGVKLMVLSAIYCTFKAGTTELLFKREDEDALMNMRLTPGSLMKKISDALSKLLNESPQAIEGNSEADPTGS